MNDLPDVPPGRTAVKIFEDPTPNAIILNRITRRAIDIAQRYTDMTEQQTSDYFELVLLVSRKMISVWRHLTAYKAEEDRLVKAFEEGAKHTEYSLELFIEFDEFTVQIKSTLDHAVKVLRPIIGPKWNLATFGDKGEKVIKALRNLGRDHDGRVKGFEKMCFDQDTRAWLKAIIDARDRVNHYQSGGVNIRNFTVGPLTDGKMAVPRWSEQQTLRDAMEASWTKFFAFLEFFVVYPLNFRMPEKHALFYQRSAIASPDSSFKVVPRSVADEFIRRMGATPA